MPYSKKPRRVELADRLRWSDNSGRSREGLHGPAQNSQGGWSARPCYNIFNYTKKTTAVTRRKTGTNTVLSFMTVPPYFLGRAPSRRPAADTGRLGGGTRGRSANRLWPAWPWRPGWPCPATRAGSGWWRDATASWQRGESFAWHNDGFPVFGVRVLPNARKTPEGVARSRRFERHALGLYLVGREGIEPPTPGLKARRSTR